MIGNLRWALALMACLPLGLQAQGFPSRPVTLVVPYPPGAATDLLARLVQPRLQAALGQTVVVENKGGANGSVGAQSVAKAPVDGHRILLATQPIVTINPHLQKDMGFDPLKDLAPLTQAVNAVVAVAVNAALPVRNMAELFAYARKNPGKLSFGTAGSGSPQHIGGLLLGQKAHIDWTHVPYKGGGPMVTDLLGGHVQVGIATLSAFKPLMADSRLRVLAIGERSRFAALPDLPTIAETLPGFELTTWLAFYAPGGTSPEVSNLLASEIGKALRAEEVRAKLLESAMVVSAEGPAALDRVGKAENAMYARVIRDNAITAD